jgi:PST family polysaccharide transporter
MSRPAEHVAVPSPESDAHHFETGHLLAGLKGRAISSGLITVAGQCVQVVLNLFSIMVLARLLVPADFGLVAMVATVIGFLRIFNDAGLSLATVQKDKITHAQVSNLFWANLGIGAAITVLLAAASPILAWFYREPRLVTVNLALCGTFLLTGSTVQHLALLKRQMRFAMIAAIQLSAATSGVLVGITMAWLDCGYWALVGMNVMPPLTACVLTWVISRWRPQRPARRSGTRDLLGFGANLTVSSFLWSLARGTDSLLIGRMFGSAALGFYSRAQALLVRPIDQFIAPLEAVFVPTLARLQDNPERYRRTLFRVFELVAVGGYAGSALLLSLAEPITRVVLGPDWDGAAAIFAGLSLVALYMPVAAVSGWLLTSQGRGKGFLTISSVCSLSAIASFVAGLAWGPVGVAVAYCSTCFLVQLPICYYVAGRSGPVTTKELWARLLRHVPIWLVMFGVTWLVRAALPGRSAPFQLLICLPLGLAAGVLVASTYPPTRKVVLSAVEALWEWRKDIRM